MKLLVEKKVKKHKLLKKSNATEIIRNNLYIKLLEKVAIRDLVDLAADYSKVDPLVAEELVNLLEDKTSEEEIKNEKLYQILKKIWYIRYAYLSVPLFFKILIYIFTN